MARTPKARSQNSDTRALLLDTAEELMREEGYAAVTSRRLGNKAGVKPTLIHYYFESMDDLFINLYRRRADRELKLIADKLAGDDVIQALWRQCSDPTHAALDIEFMALANHRKRVHAEQLKFAKELRSIQYKALRRYFRERGIKPPIAPSAIIFLLSSIGSLLALENKSGLKFGHTEAEALIRAA